MIALEAMAAAPGVGVNVDAVAVLGEAVDESADAGRTGEYAAQLLEGEVGGDDGGTVFVTAADDVVEDVGGAVVTGQIAELVEDEELWEEVALDAALEGRHGLLLEQIEVDPVFRTRG